MSEAASHSDSTARLAKLAEPLRDLTVEGYHKYIEALSAEIAKAADEDAGDALPFDEVRRRLEYASNIVSLWSHACHIDGVLAPAEEMSVSAMLHDFFGRPGSLFPPRSVDEEAVFAELIERFCMPVPLDEALDYAAAFPYLALVFFEQACCIVAADGQIAPQENPFISRVADRLNIPAVARNEIIARYIMPLSALN